jgi:hypothetical protein
MMVGRIVQVLESGSVALLVVDTPDRIVEVPMERRTCTSLPPARV